jgi:23S rRNA (adenine2503-C2)-methyltransferase
LGLTQVRAKHVRAIQPMLEHLILTPRGKMLYACLLPDFVSMPSDTGISSEPLPEPPSGPTGESFFILDSAGPESVQAAAPSMGQSLFGLSFEQLGSIMEHLGEQNFRARQLAQALYRDWIDDIGAITTLPLPLREKLASAGYAVGLPPILQTFRSIDGTERYLIGVSGNQTVETVWMPDGDGAEDEDEETTPSRKRATICVSSQIGCAVNCQFCLTAKLGIERNLTAGEIAGQVVAVLRRHQVELGRDRINLVFMGMGEPFLNYDAFMDAVRLLGGEVGLPLSRMTVSTSGIVPGIERFAREPARPRLAISLNASNNAVRESVMPITRKWPIEAVLKAARKMQLAQREKITFEYVLLGGVNDSLVHADEVVALARRADFPSKVNLIVWNPGPGIPYTQPKDEDVARFQQRLIARGVPAFIRRPRGRDIYAACGQLKKTME